MMIKFFTTSNKKEPVREWLKSLDRADCTEIGKDLQTIQLGWEKCTIGEPLVKSLGNGLFEVRTPLPSHKQSRVLFCLYKGSIILLHGFIKKTQKTPPAELALARKRQKQIKDCIY